MLLLGKYIGWQIWMVEDDTTIMFDLIVVFQTRPLLLLQIVFGTANIPFPTFYLIPAIFPSGTENQPTTNNVYALKAIDLCGNC